MEDLKFVTHTLPMSFLDMLRRPNRVVSGTTQRLLDIVFQHGGYIAGGFGTIVANHVLGIKSSEDGLVDPVRRHLGSPRKDTVGPFKNARTGDIDVWFPDVSSLDAFQGDPKRIYLIRNGDLVVNMTLTGAAEEHLIDRDARVQVIHRYLAPLEEQLARFDIYNGMVAITNDHLVVPEHFEALERASMLHVATWASQWTINRTLKWLNRKQYKTMTPATAQHFAGVLFKAVAERPTSGVQLAATVDKLTQRVWTCPQLVQKTAGPIMQGLTGEQLLQLSSLFPQPLRYDLAMREIHRRMSPK